MRAKEFFKKVWRWVRWPLAVLVVGYVVLVGFRTKYFLDKDASDAAVAKIHAAKMTREILYSGLPPEPDPAVNNATVAGVDSNNNGIRDDVERAIYFKHQDSARITAAEYQYAMTQQMFLTDVFDTATWKAVAEENGRANICISQTPGADRKEVEALVVNNPMRTGALDKAFEFITSHGSASGTPCDVSPQ